MRTNISFWSCRAVAVILFTVLAGSFSAGQAQRKKKAPPRYTVAVNTTIRVRMNDMLSSKNATVGDHFGTTVVDPVYVRGVEVIPAGSTIAGNVTHVTRASRKSSAGSINVAFNAVQLPNGKRSSLNGSLASLGEGGVNADNEGEVKGGSSKKRNVAFVAGGAVVGGLINGAAGAGIGAGLGVAGALIKKGKEAEVKPGTEFGVILNHGLVLPAYRAGN